MLIQQYHRGNWLKTGDLRNADAVEIVLGEGGCGSAGMNFAKILSDGEKSALGLPPAVQPQKTPVPPNCAANLPRLVDSLRNMTNGAPIGVRLAATQSLEAEVAMVVRAGVDFICIVAGDAGSVRGLPIFQDDFGLPTLWAIHRAKQCINKWDSNHRVSLVIIGQLSTPGDFLKCLALGADAVCVCTIALFAIMSGQQKRVLPNNPPTRMLLREAHFARRFNINEGAENLANWLQSITSEMELALRSMGKTTISDICIDDLCATEQTTAQILGIPFIGQPMEQTDCVAPHE